MGDAVKAVDRLGNIAKDILEELERVRAKLIGTTAALDRERAARVKAQAFIWRYVVSEERRRGESGPCTMCHIEDEHSSGCELAAALEEPK